MKNIKKLTYILYNKTVTVGDTLCIKWANGKIEYHIITHFDEWNGPRSIEDKKLYMDYVDWDQSILQDCGD